MHYKICTQQVIKNWSGPRPRNKAMLFSLRVLSVQPQEGVLGCTPPHYLGHPLWITKHEVLYSLNCAPHYLGHLMFLVATAPAGPTVRLHVPESQIIHDGVSSVDDLSYICGVNNKPNFDSMYMTIRRLLSALLKYDTIVPSLMDKLWTERCHDDAMGVQCIGLHFGRSLLSLLVPQDFSC